MMKMNIINFLITIVVVIGAFGGLFSRIVGRIYGTFKYRALMREAKINESRVSRFINFYCFNPLTTIALVAVRTVMVLMYFVIPWYQFEAGTLNAVYFFISVGFLIVSVLGRLYMEFVYFKSAEIQ